MASTRMTNSFRDKIVSRLTKGKFNETEAMLRQKFSDLALAVYQRLYSADFIGLLNSLPEGTVPACRCLSVQFGDDSRDYSQLYFNGEHVLLRFMCKHNNSCCLALASNDMLTLRYEQVTMEARQLKEEKEQLRKDVRRIVYSCTTTASLVKAWPELEPMMREFEDHVVVTTTEVVPFELVQELNQKLGLQKVA